MRKDLRKAPGKPVIGKKNSKKKHSKNPVKLGNVHRWTPPTAAPSLDIFKKEMKARKISPISNGKNPVNPLFFLVVEKKNWQNPSMQSLSSFYNLILVNFFFFGLESVGGGPLFF